jgi:hypothetical protein
MYAVCRDFCQAFAQFGVWSPGAATLSGAGEPEQITTVTATRESLPALGVQPLLGRWFKVEEDTPAGNRTVILSHGYWQRKFGGDPAILGRSVVVDFIPHEVIGVMPPGFRFVNQAPDVILAQRFSSTRPDEFSYHGIARLKPGFSVDQANQDIARVWQAWGEKEGHTKRLEEMALRPNARPLKKDVVGDVGLVLEVLMGALGLLLLLVCVNIANLVMARARGRQQEFAIREALGAGRGRLLRSQLVEGLSFGLIGAALGVVFAYFGIRLLVLSGPTNLPRLDELRVGPSALAFASLCAITSSLLYGSAALFKFGGAGGAMGTRGSS